MVHRLAGGNPRVMITMTDALISAGYLSFDDRGWQLHHSSRTIQASLSRPILDSVLWRFDQLENEDRVVLESAAAIGTEFSSAAVARIAGVESPLPVARRLEALCERGFVRRSGRHGRIFPPDYGVFRFQHLIHAELLADHAPIFTQLRAAERRTSLSDIGRRVG
jgi:predicted ATPase